jgi:AraC-like DNA-binding protein
MNNRIDIPGLDYIGSLESFLSYFDYYPDTRFFVKNLDSKYIYCNKPYADMLKTNPENMLGKSDYDFYDKNMADLYLEEDKKVLAGEKFINQRWMVPDEKGVISWCISHKQPLKDKDGKICGIFGTFRDLKMAGLEAKPFYDLSEIVEYIHQNYSKNITAEDLAGIIGLSTSQLNRKFKREMDESPIIYLLKVRIEKATAKLLSTDSTITEISYECGFNNQTYFNRQFKKITGFSPRDYRKKYT